MLIIAEKKSDLPDFKIFCGPWDQARSQTTNASSKYLKDLSLSSPNKKDNRQEHFDSNEDGGNTIRAIFGKFYINHVHIYLV